MNIQAREKTELNKILSLVSEFAFLPGAKRKICSLEPQTDAVAVQKLLHLTEECEKLLFRYGAQKIEPFEEFVDELDRAKKGSALSCAELLKVATLLRSTRIAFHSITTIPDAEIKLILEYANRLYFDEGLEEDIGRTILNESQVSDFASDKLYTLRREIRVLNEKIRARLGEYLTGKEGKYLQDGIVTMRNDRYVLPVKAEYKRSIKGFIHDRSATGATFFIEPEEILEMNNELKTLAIDEKEEVERILSELSRRVGLMADKLETDVDILEDIETFYARAEYGYKLSACKPKINEKGQVSIVEGRHPLIDRKKVVPVSLSLGKDYRILLISGPNTGGKTVTLKMVGLFCMMAMCGLFLPAKMAEVSVFEDIYCDIGDLQSIEANLSTFSSHVTNIVDIVNKANERTLVLIDELGGGTDPEEGQALAKAVVEYLLSTRCVGVVTTHYTALKEYAFATKGIENACMEFDSSTLQPLYVVRLGLPGSSNALAISKRLGMKESILKSAMANLSSGAQSFEHIIRSAEDSRIKADEALKETNKIKREWETKLLALEEEQSRLKNEKEKFYSLAKAESRRIIHEKTAEAEELLGEIENIFAKQAISEADIIQARTLKNKLYNKSFEAFEEEMALPQYLPIDRSLKVGEKVFVKQMASEGVVQSVREEKKEAEVLCNNLRLRVKFGDLSFVVEKTKPVKKISSPKKKETVTVSKNLQKRTASGLEINLLGLTVGEAIPEVEAFLDRAVLANFEEVRIVHGMGTGKLRAGIHAHLKTNPVVAEFRLGKYGEGDTGVTIVKLK